MPCYHFSHHAPNTSHLLGQAKLLLIPALWATLFLGDFSQRSNTTIKISAPLFCSTVCTSQGTKAWLGIPLTCFAVLRHALSVSFGIHRHQGDGVQGVGLKATEDSVGGSASHLLL